MTKVKQKAIAKAKLMPKARFITFEGGEGVGKSTQAKRLVNSLKNKAIMAVRTREPGGTPKAEAIRSFILQGKSESWGAGAEAILFASARLDHVNELIAPNLKKGTWVISDRFLDSTRAYQGLTGGVNDTLISALEELALNDNNPDLTILLDMDPKKAFQRMRTRDADKSLAGEVDRFEKENLDWHIKLRENFIKIANNNTKRFVIISADKSEEDLAKAIWQAVVSKFPELKEEKKT